MGKSSVKTNLKEGEYYPFKITGFVILPDGAECFILSDVNKVKHLLYKKYYKNYNLQLNSEVLCRIDKINCTGKIFIEPEHPFYKLGKTYHFIFDHYKEIVNSTGEMERLAVLKNGYSEDIYLGENEIEKPIKKGYKVKAVVEKLKKGRVYIAVGSVMNDYTGMEAGKKDRFSLIKQVTVRGKYAYYLLKNDNGKEFRIRKKYYDKYGFKVGDKITCELMENDHQVFLEPVHPYYEIGFNYEFKVIGETLIDEYPNKQKEAYLLENKYGQDIILKKEEVDPEHIKDNCIKCAVTAIKKSQIFLACQ